jgi:hypothetical protein
MQRSPQACVPGPQNSPHRTPSQVGCEPGGAVQGVQAKTPQLLIDVLSAQVDPQRWVPLGQGSWLLGADVAASRPPGPAASTDGPLATSVRVPISVPADNAPSLETCASTRAGLTPVPLASAGSSVGNSLRGVEQAVVAAASITMIANSCRQAGPRPGDALLALAPADDDNIVRAVLTCPHFPAKRFSDAQVSWLTGTLPPAARTDARSGPWRRRDPRGCPVRRPRPFRSPGCDPPCAPSGSGGR